MWSRTEGTFNAPIVISNAGIQPTVLKLVGEEHFDKSYVNYVKELVPSWGFMGARYFLDAKVIDDPFGTLFSADSPWTLEKCRRAGEGDLPDDMCVWFESPVQLRSRRCAPKGKQIILTGHYGPADPMLSEEPRSRSGGTSATGSSSRPSPTSRPTSSDRSTIPPRRSRAISRDHVLPGQGGETIGLGQVVGQDGRYKPAVKAPIRGPLLRGLLTPAAAALAPSRRRTPASTSRTSFTATS